jgi:asparagine synthase (glutamine-hydrolysing)
MCGIAGFYGNFEPSLLKKMGDSVAHRGPDGQGERVLHFQDRWVGLSHRRLSILDLSSSGNQPMSFSPESNDVSVSGKSSEQSVWITYNGEIYNFPELKQELESKGHRFKSQTDTEVILHLYSEYGLDAFSKIKGIFALALYDGRRSGQRDGIKQGDLILFRDGLGVKPLYYSENSKGFLFASEIKSILRCSEVERELDLQALKYFISYLYCPAPQTPFENIKKVEPGEWLLVREGRIASKKYFYDIPYGQTLGENSEQQVTEQLRAKLKLAAKRQLISDVPVGAFLSGGLDSTSVVALMKEVEPTQSFRCFTIGHEHKEGSLKNDLFYAKEVASKFGFPLTVVDVTPSDFSSLSKVIFHLDEPQADPAAINALLISKKARELGIKVLLSGAGGDDIFSGYPRHIAVQLERIWGIIPEPLKKALSNTTQNWLGSRGGTTLIRDFRLRKIAKVLESLSWDTDTRISSYFMSSFPSAVNPILGERFRIEKNSNRDFDPFLRSLDRVNKDAGLLNKMLYLETKHFLADHNLNYVDKMSMSQGVEVRVPLIDPDIVDFVAKIPPNLKCRYFENKYIFKQAVKPYVPEEILNRKKQGFGLPIRHWLNTDLKETVRDALSESSLDERGLFDSKMVNQIIEKDRKRQIDATYLIFSMMSIELWCREFLDKNYSSVQSNELRASLPL